MRKVKWLSLVLMAVLAVTGCSKKDGQEVDGKQKSESVKSEKKKDSKKDVFTVDKLPASGAKTYVTSYAGAVNTMQDVGKALTSEQFLESAASIVDLDAISENIENTLDNSAYVENMAVLFEKYQRIIDDAVDNFVENGTFELSIDEKPGKATDFPANYSLDIPQIKLIAKASTDNLENPNKGLVDVDASTSFSVQADKIKVDLNDFSVKLKADFDVDPIKQALAGTATLTDRIAFKSEMEGARVELKNFNLDVSGKGNYDGEKGGVTAEIKNGFSGEVEIDTKKLGLGDAYPIKYVKSNLGITGLAKGSPSINSRGGIRGSVDYDYQIKGETGISFASPDGTGGKLFCVSDIKFKGDLNLAEVAQWETILGDLFNDLAGKGKLTKEEFDELKLPIDVNFSAKFYDDKNNETFTFMDLKNAYDLYTYLYDLSGTLGENFDPEELEYMIDDIVDFVEDIIYDLF